jgi:transposase InsO family protein
VFEDEEKESLISAAGRTAAEGVDDISLDRDRGLLKNVPFDVVVDVTPEVRERAKAPDPNYDEKGYPRRPHPKMLVTDDTIEKAVDDPVVQAMFGDGEIGLLERELGFAPDLPEPSDDSAELGQWEKCWCAATTLAAAKRARRAAKGENVAVHPRKKTASQPKAGARETAEMRDSGEIIDLLERKREKLRATRFGPLDGVPTRLAIRMPTYRQMEESQRRDLTALWMYMKRETDERPPGFSAGLRLEWQEMEACAIIGVVSEDASGEETWTPVVPQKWRMPFLQLAHEADFSGHRGGAATVDYLRRIAYWPSMDADAKQWAKNCPQCGAQRPFTRAQAPTLSTFSAHRPGMVLHMDYIGPFHKSGRDGAEYVLTMRDRFSGFTMLRRCRNANALDTVRGFVEQWVAIFGVPHRVITDQGAHFKGKEMRLLAHFFGIDHIRTTAYHPQTNGKVERVHQDIKAQLRKLCEESHDLWEDKLAAVQFTINNTKK